ncbi:Glycosyltransferase Family 1 protein [Gigaspora rosea]|uniref:Glycosyltransferase Family 1 protein n=1 Tax=Gigaspora rosea TaxID=44941 RepID=A0A397UQJ0_9GLOM|nr:Glycosyltransferase Family 1 protein [Gigaspora rosea]
MAKSKLPKFIQRDSSLNRINIPKNILATSYIGGGSHVAPMCEILIILMDRGYNVTLVAPGNFTAKSDFYRSIPQIITEEKSGFGVIANKEQLKKISFQKPDVKLMSDAFNRENYIKYYNLYRQTAEEINADLLFCDHGMNHACFDLASKLEKPVVGFSSSPSFTITSPPYKSDPFFGCHVNMENESFYERFKCAIVIHLQNIWTMTKFIYNLNNIRADLGVEPHWDPRGRINNILILLNTFPGYEIPSAMLPLHQEVGPILPDTFPNLNPELDSFLNAHPRTLYFALGTNIITSPQNIVTILKSFLELINQNIIDGVIWATVKVDITELMPFSNINFPLSEILNNNYPHIHITKFAPQFAILSHENTKIFLSHGGTISAYESIYTATPILALPITSDHYGNSEKLVLAGIALGISKLNLTVDDIILKIKRLLSEVSFKKNAERLQFIAKINSNRKYKAADLIEMMMNTAKYDGVKDENGNLRINNNVLQRDWITPDARMGFIQGKYIDVYGTFIIIVVALVGGFNYILLKFIGFLYTKHKDRIRNSKSKKE